MIKMAGFLFGTKEKKGHIYFADRNDIVGEFSLVSRWNKLQPERFSVSDVTDVHLLGTVSCFESVYEHKAILTCCVVVTEDIAVYQQMSANPVLGRRLYRRICLRLGGYIYDTPLPGAPKERGHRKDKAEKESGSKLKKQESVFDIKAPKEFKCRLRDVVTAQGTLTISSTAVTFYGRIFGCESKASLPMHPSYIKDATAEDGDLVISTAERQVRILARAFEYTWCNL